MIKSGIKRGGKKSSILRIYTISCILFFFFSVFNLYSFKVYDTWSLIVFYIYEGILWIGIYAGGGRYRFSFFPKRSITNRYSFRINRQGQILIYCIYIGAVLSFIYFLILYRGSFKIASFGSSIKAEYDEVARTKLEVVTQFILYAGSAVYLIVIGSKRSVSKFTLRMARICLFLPGLRGAFLGRRFTLAVEALIFLFAEYESIRKKLREMDPKSKKTLRRILIIAIIVVFVLLYIFSRRVVYFPDSLLIATPGDMTLKPFWKWVYSQIGDRMNILAYVSFYAGHAPYAFSYSYANVFPAIPQYWGLSTFRVIIQIITSLFGIHPNYAEMAYQVPGIARYTGYAGAAIQDFGIYVAPVASFFFGYIFGKIERCRFTSGICHSLYPIIQVACVFAPVYFFSVGAVDQMVFWVIILAPLCVSRCEPGIEDILDLNL